MEALPEYLSPSTDTEFVTDGKALRTNFLWTFLGNGIYSVCQWGMLSVLAKLTNPQSVGYFALGLAITAPIMMFFNMQLREVQATDARGEFRYKDYFGFRLGSTLLALVVIVLIAGSYGGRASAIILILGAAKGFEALSDIVYGFLQKHEIMIRISKSMILKGILSLTSLGILTWLTKNILVGCLGLLFTWGALFIAYDLRGPSIISAERPVYPSSGLTRSTARKILSRALPLGIASLLMSLRANIPRYVIESVMGSYQLGIFSAMAYPMVAGNTIVTALGQTAVPGLARHYAKGDIRAFTILILKGLGVALAIGLAGISVAAIAGRWLLSLIYTNEYAQHNAVFVLLMTAGAVGYLWFFLGYALTAARRFHIQTISFAVNLLVTLALCLAFKGSGILGVSRAILLGSISQVIIGGIALARVIGEGSMPNPGASISMRPPVES